MVAGINSSLVWPVLLLGAFTVLGFEGCGKAESASSQSLVQRTQSGTPGIKDQSTTEPDVKETQVEEAHSSEPPTMSWRDAAISGDLEQLNAHLYHHKYELDQADSEGYTPLIAAACSGRESIVKYLLAHGASTKGIFTNLLSIRSLQDEKAARFRTTAVSVLLAQHVDPQLEQSSENDLLSLAKQNDPNGEICSILVNNGLWSSTWVGAALTSRDLSPIDKLIISRQGEKSGGTWGLKSDEAVLDIMRNRATLDFALENGYAVDVDYFHIVLENSPGRDDECSDIVQFSKLSPKVWANKGLVALAVNRGMPLTLLSLLEAGCSANERSRSGGYPINELYFAPRSWRESLAKILVVRGADLTKLDASTMKQLNFEHDPAADLIATAMKKNR